MICQEMLTEGGIAVTNSEAMLISYIVEYETTKMYFKVRLSQKVFENLKPRLEKGWAKLLSQIKEDKME